MAAGLWEDRQYSLDEIAAHIEAEKAQGLRQAPTIREAAASAPFVKQNEFVAAAVMVGFHRSTAAIQFRKSREFWRLFQIEAGEIQATPEEKAAAIDRLKKWSW